MKTSHALLPALLLAALGASLPAHAARNIYKWVDPATGITQFSDTVPPALESRATLLTRRNTNTAQDSALAFNTEAWRKQQLAQPVPVPDASVAAPTPPAVVPAKPQRPNRDALLAAYRASQECFEQFRNANATLKPQAFEVCTEMKDPNGDPIRSSTDLSELHANNQP